MMNERKMSAQQLLDGLIEFSSGKLNKKEDLERLILLSLDSDKRENLEDLAFQGKYLMGLLRIVQTSSVISDDQYQKKIAFELQSAYTTIQEKIRLILEGGSKFMKEIFDEKYLGLTQECLANLNKLCSDLSLLKLYLNDLKQK